MSTFVIVGGGTATAAIEGLSAAGADPDLRRHTPAADLEIVAAGQPRGAPVVPVSPSGTPTPAVVTRAVREFVGFDLVPVDAGLFAPAGVATHDLDAAPGADIREPVAVRSPGAIRERARSLGADLDADHVHVGETIPGGTTTALGVLRALGERATVSSSLPENPLQRKREVTTEGLDASGLSDGDAAGEPERALAAVGDPVLAAILGLLEGVPPGTRLTLAGGTQLAAAAALARHAGLEADLELATTSFVARDDSADVEGLAADLDLALSVTDPGFERHGCPATEGYVAGEAREGVGMGGALALADAAGVSDATLCEQIDAVDDRLLSPDTSTPVSTHD